MPVLGRETCLAASGRDGSPSRPPGLTNRSLYEPVPNGAKIRNFSFLIVIAIVISRTPNRIKIKSKIMIMTKRGAYLSAIHAYPFILCSYFTQNAPGAREKPPSSA